MTTMSVVGECFFWYRLTRVVPDNFHRAVKRLCVCVCALLEMSSVSDMFAVVEDTRQQRVKQLTMTDACLLHLASSFEYNTMGMFVKPCSHCTD